MSEIISWSIDIKSPVSLYNVKYQPYGGVRLSAELQLLLAGTLSIPEMITLVNME
jgi:hypothetical protein